MLDFVVVGGGPVGLLCAVALRRSGRSVTVLERCASPRTQTRSIGIHAASLAGLARLGLVDDFLARGVRIARGIAVGSRGVLGELEFGVGASEFGYALTVPQPQTEALLEAAAWHDGVRVVRGARVCALIQRRDHVLIGYEREHGPAQPRELRWLTARMLLACDGAHSHVRQLLRIPCPRRRLPGSYVMAEFPRTPALGEDAWIFLSDAGLVESFPLPGERRRWVVEVEQRREQVDLEQLRAQVEARTGHVLDLDSSAGLEAGFEPHASGFGIVQALAAEFRRGHCLLLGDAAHVVSPFGGLGMNLGWLDAFALADRVAHEWTPKGLAGATLDQWASQRRRAAQLALRQAAINSWLGRRSSAPRLRNGLVRLALAGPWRPALARRVAMETLA